MLLVVVAVMVSVACSPVGAPCKTFGEVQCLTSTASVFCLGAEYHWAEIDCPGGCTGGACDFTGVEADVPCPASMVDKGQCETRMGTPVAVSCDSATKRWKTQPCPSGCKLFTTEFDGGFAGQPRCF